MDVCWIVYEGNKRKIKSNKICKLFWTLVSGNAFILEFGKRIIEISKQNIHVKNVHNLRNLQIRDKLIIVVRTICTNTTSGKKWLEIQWFLTNDLLWLTICVLIREILIANEMRKLFHFPYFAIWFHFDSSFDLTWTNRLLLLLASSIDVNFTFKWIHSTKSIETWIISCNQKSHRLHHSQIVHYCNATRIVVMEKNWNCVQSIKWN